MKIVCDITSFHSCSTPTPAQYTEVIAALLTNYPALKNGLLGQDAMVYNRQFVTFEFSQRFFCLFVCLFVCFFSKLNYD